MHYSYEVTIETTDTVADPLEFEIKLGSGITLAHLQEMYADGWAMCNHSVSHPSSWHLQTETQIRANVVGCRDYLIANGMPRAANHMIYPGGGYNDTVDAVVRSEGCLTGRLYGYGKMDAPYYNLYGLPVYAIDKSISLAVAKGLVDACLLHRTNYIFVFHQIIVSGGTSADWYTADFEALIDYIVQKKIDCITIDEWYEGVMGNPRYRSLPVTRA